jgi:hypothetical protein
MSLQSYNHLDPFLAELTTRLSRECLQRGEEHDGCDLIEPLR